MGTGNTINAKLKKVLKIQNYKINNVNIPQKTSIKYLGIIFNIKNNYIHHFSHIINKLNIRYLQLRKFINSQLIQRKIKIYIYKQYLRPIIQYGAPIWLNPSTLSAHQMERIRHIERKLLRKTANIFRKRNTYTYISNTKLYEETEIIPIDKQLTKINIEFHDKCKNSASNNIANLTINGNNNNAKYKYTNYLYKLHSNNDLFTNNKLLMMCGRVMARSATGQVVMIYFTNYIL